MRVLVMVAVLGAVIYLVLRLVDASRQPSVRARPALTTLDTGEYEEPAALADGPDRGFGQLRLTPSQLIFLGNSGRVTTIERIDITGVSSTTNLPQRETAKPVLAVATREGIHYFAVDNPGAWERRLL